MFKMYSSELLANPGKDFDLLSSQFPFGPGFWTRQCAMLPDHFLQLDSF